MTVDVNLSRLSKPRWPLFSLLGLLLLALPTPATGAERTEWLFVVDTSYSMKRRHENTLKIVRELFTNEFNGLIRGGESIRIWTFREQIITNEFKPMVWDGDTAHRSKGSEQAIRYLSTQKYARKTKLLPVMQAIQKEASVARRLVVFLITDGDDEVKGTPYDGILNGDFMLYRSNLRRAKFPFLTMLVYERGYCVSARVHPGIGHISIPLSLPPEVVPPDETINEELQNDSINQTPDLLSPSVSEAATSIDEADRSTVEAPQGEQVIERPAPGEIIIETESMQRTRAEEANPPRDIVDARVAEVLQANQQTESSAHRSGNEPPPGIVPEVAAYEEATAMKAARIGEDITVSNPEHKKTSNETLKGNRISLTTWFVAMIGIGAAGALLFPRKKRHASLISESFNKK